MPAPSRLSIATSSLQRLVKEEASYHTELEMQQKSIARHEKLRASDQEGGDDDDESGNQQFLLEQERRGVEETKAIFPLLKKRIAEAVANLEGLVASAAEGDADVARAKEAIEHGKAAIG